MATITKNINGSICYLTSVLGINTGKKTSPANNIYKSYTTTASKKWYRQSTVKRTIMDWDMNQNELEFE